MLRMAGECRHVEAAPAAPKARPVGVCPCVVAALPALAVSPGTAWAKRPPLLWRGVALVHPWCCQGAARTPLQGQVVHHPRRRRRSAARPLQLALVCAASWRSWSACAVRYGAGHWGSEQRIHPRAAHSESGPCCWLCPSQLYWGSGAASPSGPGWESAGLAGCRPSPDAVAGCCLRLAAGCHGMCLLRCDVGRRCGGMP